MSKLALVKDSIIDWCHQRCLVLSLYSTAVITQLQCFQLQTSRERLECPKLLCRAPR